MQENIKKFQDTVWNYYEQNGRFLPWRHLVDGQIEPYYVLVSELMLQQTQVQRVVHKYDTFLELFPTIDALAQAPLADVIKAWSGLGYNRRAKYLHDVAKNIAGKKFPKSTAELIQNKGIGMNTAAAIQVYSFNTREVFVETNIRTVYIHHFFAQKQDVTDKKILELVEATLPTENYREWYWALMDYGTYLKYKGANNTASKQYKKQSKFHGSNRQLRGRILRYLSDVDSPVSLQELHTVINDTRLDSVLDALHRDGLIVTSSRTVSLP